MSTAIYDPMIQAAANGFGIPFGLLKGLIAHESNFNPKAYRVEAAINDASRGLMQLLYATAKGLGYVGTPDGLFDPVVNVGLGAKLLRSRYDELGHDWLRALSAYNGGDRASLGFGTRVMQPVTICLARDTSGKCVRTYTAQPGQFGNQPYVDAVLSAAKAYGWTPDGVVLPPAPDLSDVRVPSSADILATLPKAPGTVGGPGKPAASIVLFLVATALLLLFGRR